MLTGSEPARSSSACGALAVAAGELGLVVLHAGMRRFQRPQPARPLLQVRPLVLVVVAVAGVAHVHRQSVGRILVVRHALGVVAGEPVLGLEQRAVRIGDVVAVARVVVGELPVALVLDAVRLAHHHLAAGIAVEPLVDDRRDRAEVLDERQRVHVERAEDEAAIGFHARHLRDVVLRVAQVGRVAVRPRHAAQLAGVVEIPAVIRALEVPRVALLEAAQRGAAMGAAVVQRADLALAVAHDDQRAQAHAPGDEVVVVGDLALVRQVGPGAAEDVGHLGLEHGGIGVDQPMRAVLLHEVVPIVQRGAAEPGR